MRKIASLVLCLVLLVACGGQNDGPRRAKRDPGEAPPISLPEPEAALPAYLVFSETPLTDEALASLEDVPGLAVAAGASIGEMQVAGPAGVSDMRVAAVDPIEFRPVAPTSSRDAEFVWSEMASGEAIVTFAGADALGLGGGGTIVAGKSKLVVGAYADNGVPNIAEVMVNEQVGRDLGLDDPHWLAVGAKPTANLQQLGHALEKRLPDARIAGLLPDPPDVIEPGDPEAVGEATGSLIGTMEFKILEDGFIKPNQEWIDENIATADVAIIGEVTCHRLLIPQLQSAMNEIVADGLSQLIRADDYGGCYVPRFIDRNPDLPLSMHAFGLAFDINVSTNLLGTQGDMDERVVDIFEKWGFEWGGIWDRPDPMHFELARIVQP
jgi:hypothetical protein